MLTFLKRIRFRLFGLETLDEASRSNTRISRYFIYAIGEIALVVIGILIALMVNNFNEDKAQKMRFLRLFDQISANLIEEVSITEDLLDFYFIKDSIIDVERKTQLKPSDFNDPFGNDPRNTLLIIGIMDINEIAFNQIRTLIDRTPPEYEMIINEMSTLYDKESKELLDIQRRLSEASRQFKETMISTYPWYAKIRSPELPQEAVDYFISDPIYKNRLEDFNEMGHEIWFEMNGYREQAILALNMLSELPELKLKDTLHTMGFYIDPEFAKEIDGTYFISEWNHEFRIKVNGSHLVTDFMEDPEGQLSPTSKTEFNYTSAFYKMEFISGERLSIKLTSSNGHQIKALKIKNL